MQPETFAPRHPEWRWYTGMIQMYAAMLRSGTPFSQANYGDGEWACILGHEGENVNGEVYEPELRDALRKTLLEPAGQWCGTNTGGKYDDEVEAWVETHGVDVPWVFKDALSAANVNGALGPVFRALRERDVVVVGGPHLADLPDEVVGDHDFVEVHSSEAWKDWGSTAQSVLHSVQGNEVFVFCAGMASNLMIHKLEDPLWKARSEVTLLDMGACLDPYVGVYSRKNYRKDRFKNEMMERNLAGVETGLAGAETDLASAETGLQ